MKFVFYHIKQFVFFLVAATVLVLVIPGCSKDSREFILPDDGGEEPDDEITLILRIPAQETPLSRSMNNGEDYMVKEAVILAFSVETSPYKETLAYYREGRYISSSSDNNLYSVTFRAQLKKGNYKLAIIANPDANLKERLSKLKEDGITDKVQILELMQYENTGKWNAGNNYTPILMYAETGLVTIDTGTTLNATPMLIRMLARIDVTVNLDNSSEGTFLLEKIYLANYNTRGYVAPVWNSNGITATEITTVNLPPVPGVNRNSPLEYIVPGADETSATCKGEIYIFETDKATNYTSDTDFYNSVCLILEGSFNGETNTFYRVDITNTGTGMYMPILRNHQYDITITQANRPGYSTLEEALHSYGVASNGTLKVKTLSYYKGDLTRIVYDGEYMLGTDTKEEPYEFTPEGGNGTFIIYTNYPSGFTLKAVNPQSGQQINWITLIQAGSGTQTITYIVSPNSTTAMREANIILSAGRLRETIHIRQTGSS